MSRLAVSFRVALLATAVALAGACDHVERTNLDPARERWTSSKDSLLTRAAELRTRQQALAGRINALQVPAGVTDAPLATAIERLKGQLEVLDRACAESERALSQTTANVEVALGKPNKIAAKQIVDSGLTSFDTAADAAQRALDEVTPQVAATEAMMRRHLETIAADVQRFDALAASGGSIELEDLAFRAGTAELELSQPATKVALDRLTSFARACDQLRFTLTGHVSRGGSAGAAKSLSQARADAVKAYLVSAGVEPAKIAGTAGAGTTRPTAAEPEPGSPEEAAMPPAEREARRRKNQRITLLVTAPCTTALPPTAPPPGAAGAPGAAPSGAQVEGVDRAGTVPISPTRPVRATAPRGGRMPAPGITPVPGTAPIE